MDKSTIESSLISAIAQCDSAILEEEGGVIVVKDDSFKFIKLTNDNAGKPIARGLWTANPKEYGQKVITTFRDGWKQHASFHTHPQFAPYPSDIDLTKLFQSFKTNYIYSNKYNRLVRYTWNAAGDALDGFEIDL